MSARESIILPFGVAAKYRVNEKRAMIRYDELLSFIIQKKNVETVCIMEADGYVCIIYSRSVLVSMLMIIPVLSFRL